MRIRIAGAALIIAAVSFLALSAKDRVHEWIVVDRCLDQGGSFDYARMTCDQSANHPFVSYAERHPDFPTKFKVRTALGVAVGTVGFILFSSGRRSRNGV
jgi:hypothetical protein